MYKAFAKSLCDCPSSHVFSEVSEILVVMRSIYCNGDLRCVAIKDIFNFTQVGD